MNLSLYLFLYKMIDLLFDMAYSRLQELEADKHGIFLAKASGYQASDALSVQKIFISLEGRENKPIGWFKRINGLIHTHPYNQVRFKENEKTILRLKKEKID
ncbi:MAG: M48 family metalloprotease [Candidatus Rhabdochlamydia sp.]|nr:Peptidase family [Chlamydiota bacterium]